MKKKIGFFAHGPASANALHPLIQTIEKSHEVCLYAFHPYVADVWACPLQSEVSLEGIDFSLFDLVIYGTGSHHLVETTVPYHARKQQVPSLSVLDSFWSSDKNCQKRFEHPPDYLFVPDIQTKNQIKRLGLVPDSHIYAYGNPHFDRLHTYKALPKTLTYPLTMVCYSCPSSSESFSDTDESIKNLLRLMSCMEYSTPGTIKQLFITAHPRENTEWLTEFVRPYDFMHLRSHEESFRLLLETDVSVGNHSTLQYEGLIIGKPTIFYDHTVQFLSDFSKLQESHHPIQVSFRATKKITEWIHRFLENK